MDTNKPVLLKVLSSYLILFGIYTVLEYYSSLYSFVPQYGKFNINFLGILGLFCGVGLLMSGVKVYQYHDWARKLAVFLLIFLTIMYAREIYFTAKFIWTNITTLSLGAKLILHMVISLLKEIMLLFLYIIPVYLLMCSEFRQLFTPKD